MKKISELTDNIKMMKKEEIDGLHQDYADIVEYRKSGLSLNHIIGCPMNCSYCIRHAYDNFDMKSPHGIMSDENAVNCLINSKYFKRDLTPLQLFNRATDPFLPAVKPHTFKVIELLEQKGLKNNILIFTRFKVNKKDTDILNKIKTLKLTILITYSGIKDKSIEPIDNNIPEESLKTLYAYAKNYKVILAWRPIIPTVNDTDTYFDKIKELSNYSHGIAFTGLFFRDKIKEYYTNNNLPLIYDESARRKILPHKIENRILEKLKSISDKGKLFRKVSCCLSSSRSISDYNGHYGISEICEICPSKQKNICKNSFHKPKKTQIDSLIKDISNFTHKYELKENSIEIEGLEEEQRYYLQHNLNFQIHDTKYKHLKGQHGRAHIGWGKINNKVKE
jgi:DNA repair photolyase